MVEIWHWHTEPALIAGILFVAWLYFLAVGPFRGRLGGDVERYPKREAVYFIVGVLSFYIAVGSPIDAAGEGFLFSAHMIQHNILMYITPIFTLLALPSWLVDHFLRKRNFLSRSFRFLLHPLVAGVLFTATFNAWHFQDLYEAALHDKRIHMIEHLTMYFSSCFMIWAILSPSQLLPRMNYGLQVLYLFLLMVAQIPLFGILTFATEVLYPTYELAPRLFDFLDPLSDQVLGGLIMKVANMIFSLGFMVFAFIRWNQETK